MVLLSPDLTRYCYGCSLPQNTFGQDVNFSQETHDKLLRHRNDNKKSDAGQSNIHIFALATTQSIWEDNCVTYSSAKAKHAAGGQMLVQDIYVWLIAGWKSTHSWLSWRYIIHFIASTLQSETRGSITHKILSSNLIMPHLWGFLKFEAMIMLRKNQCTGVNCVKELSLTTGPCNVRASPRKKFFSFRMIPKPHFNWGKEEGGRKRRRKKKKCLKSVQITYTIKEWIWGNFYRKT